jgi:hypothetical protein
MGNAAKKRTSNAQEPGRKDCKGVPRIDPFGPFVNMASDLFVSRAGQGDVAEVLRRLKFGQDINAKHAVSLCPGAPDVFVGFGDRSLVVFAVIGSYRPARCSRRGPYASNNCTVRCWCRCERATAGESLIAASKIAKRHLWAATVAAPVILTPFPVSRGRWTLRCTLL